MEQPDLSDGAAGAGIEGFREEQLPRVRAYVAVVCSPERSEEAESAALVDFLARAGGRAATGGQASAPDQLERELLRATRSAAAGRFDVVVPLGRPELHLTSECRAMPELLALHANGERPEDEALLAGHLASCPVCSHTLNRMQEAERAFARGAGELPSLEFVATTVDTSKAQPASPPPRRPDPVPEREPPRAGEPSGVSEPPAASEPSAATYRRRSGGLVGAIRKLGRPARG